LKEEPRTPLGDFIPVRLYKKRPGFRSPLARAEIVRQRDLFTPKSTTAAGRKTGPGPTIEGESAVFSLRRGLKVSIRTDNVRPGTVQVFLTALLRSAGARRNVERVPLFTSLIDSGAALSVSTSDPGIPDIAQELWNAISAAGALEDAETATTLKLYGSKLRLTPLLVGAVCSVLPAGAPILDVMSGTGIVTRKLSGRFGVTANDANAYAALLTRAQGARLDRSVDELLVSIKSEARANLRSLMKLAPAAFADEADLLHGEFSEKSLKRYRQFCSSPAFGAEGRPGPQEPYQLCVGRYANVYFGLTQCAQIDSLRAAIDEVATSPGDLRDLCLAAVLVAASICNSGPHFAQPRAISNVLNFRDVAERRARDLVWEFELALRNLVARPALIVPLQDVTQTDWEPAVKAFAARVGKRGPAAVYFDPPYSKLQFSRYYHVLNVILAYDYPPIEGVGRYPPLSMRFSSRFENRARSAKSEFEKAFVLCRELGLNVLVSYSDRGFVPIDTLTELMLAVFSDVTIFSESIRHHSQGVSLGDRQGRVTEFVLVGRL
jgi:hypothetical protein